MDLSALRIISQQNFFVGNNFLAKSFGGCIANDLKILRTLKRGQKY
jgi:hypothetical protein